MNLQDLISLDGQLELYAQNGHFLGLLSSDRHNPNSIINVRTYGNKHNINSIYYEHGIYGGQYGQHSPYNRCCLYPPTIVFQQQFVALVSKNKYILDRDLAIFDPDMTLAIYVNLSNQVAPLALNKNNSGLSSKMSMARSKSRTWQQIDRDRLYFPVPDNAN